MTVSFLDDESDNGNGLYNDCLYSLKLREKVLNCNGQMILAQIHKTWNLEGDVCERFGGRINSSKLLHKYDLQWLNVETFRL